MDQEARDNLLSSFCEITSASPNEAGSILASSNWNLETALSLYYAQQEGNDEEMHSDAGNDTSSAPPPAPVPGGGRTLGGDYVPPAPGTESRPTSSRNPQRGGMRTLKDLQGGGGAGHSHGHGADDDDSENEQDFFAGGEKSGLAVQNPGNQEDQVNRILQRARQGAPHPPPDAPEAPRTAFRGGGHTLGGDDAESEYVPDPTASRRPPPARVDRTLHIWRNGFSVDDGDLYRFDDPANAEILQFINQGRAPLSILNVEVGQEVDLHLDPHRDEDFQPPKKKYKPFSGQGQRLGSPTPGVTSSSTQQTGTAGFSGSAGAAPSSSSSEPPKVNVDESQPTITLQLRLGDGTQLRSRFNATHTIGDVYSFVNAARTESQRPYVLMTTFPSKELSDKAAVLGDLPEFKRGGVVVQKWT